MNMKAEAIKPLKYVGQMYFLLISCQVYITLASSSSMPLIH